MLLVLPLLHLGMVNDLMMRAGIPALFIIMYEMLRVYNGHIPLEGESIAQKLKSGGKKMIVVGMLVLFLIYGAIYPLSNIMMNLGTSNGLNPTELYTWGTAGIYADRTLDEENVARIREKKYNYFTYDIEETVFYRFIARKEAEFEEIEDK